jgi:hypothetical protein
MQVTKRRGLRFRGGYHDFRIKTGGIEVYPRIRSDHHPDSVVRGSLADGYAELDELMGGGLAGGTSLLITGAAGTGKSVLATQFACAPAGRGEHVRFSCSTNVSEEANRAKADFLAVMSHELRTPLNAMGGYAQLMALGVRGPLTEEQRLDLQRIDKSQRHLLSLINDILNFAKIEAGHVAFDIAPVSVQTLLREVEPLLRPQLSAKSIEYSDGGAACDATVLADEEKARQILLNLLTNAIKFTPVRGNIDVSCDRRRRSGDHGAGQRHRPRHRRRKAVNDLRAVRPTRARLRIATGGHWPRARHQPRSGTSHGRGSRRGERAGSWRGLHAHVAARGRTRCRCPCTYRPRGSVARASNAWSGR